MLFEIIIWSISILAFINYGFMAYDGSRGLILGDYVRPKKGPYAGQLGPWSNLVQRIGIDPGSTLMKVIFLLWGLAGIGITLAFFLKVEGSWNLQLGLAIATLWYLVPGTILSVLQVVLLLLLRFL